MPTFAFCIAAALLNVWPASAAVHRYRDEPLETLEDAWGLKAGHEGMYRSRHHVVDTVLTPKHAGTNDGKSVIKLTDLFFRRPESAVQNVVEGQVYTGFVEVLVFERSQQPQIGYAAQDGWRYCCDEEWAKQTKCPLHRVYIADAPPVGADEPVSALSAIVSAFSDGSNSTQRRLVLDDADTTIAFGAQPTDTLEETARDDNAATNTDQEDRPYAGFPWRTEVDFLGKNLSTGIIIDDTVTIRESGVYSMWFVSCDPSMADVYATGRSVFKNPRGYLPGERQPLLPFHAALSLLYIILAATWLSVHLLNAGHIIAQQHLITLCLALGMLEACMDYADMHTVNSRGFNLPSLMVAAAAVGSAFRACIRVTVVLLSKGFGTLRPSGCDRVTLMLGIAYFCAAFALDIKLLVNAGDEDAKYRVLPVFRVPVAILDVTIAMMVSKSLYSTSSHLRAKGSKLRLCVYRCFAVCMTLVGMASLGYIAFESLFHATHRQHEKWQFEWMHATFWHLIHFAATAMLCILWAPGDLVAVFRVHRTSQGRHDDDDDLTSLHIPFGGTSPRGGKTA